ncbi:hypothetical protein [Halapricum hydrolyticum]|uniref:Uncharacterized protein n=1 Tax=Halapricum hydrolyticum TaxID=2979991 RepID=A0AAE3IDE7_9EURY|nr:hypothetical protein [Halapricum hydrolyticum]MCU4717998.1 hypothetical protein [Halapricum hydrolyticum]MCU4727163.1 hypothetical protein [Halapricum hydrolyticum]
MRRRQVLVSLSVVTVLLLLGSAVAARPPPSPLCDVCTDDVVENSTVEHSTVVIDIGEDGASRWTVTLELDGQPDAEAIRTAARRELSDSPNGSSVRTLSVTSTPDGVELSHEGARMGHRSAGGVLVVDYFHTGGDAEWFGVNADRIVVRGPPESVLVRDPVRSAFVDDRDWIDANETTLVLTGVHGDRFDRTISGGWYLVFGSDSGLVATAAANLGIWADVAQLKLDSVPGPAPFPAAILAAFVVILVRHGDTLARLSRFGRARSLLGTGAGLALASLLLAPVSGGVSIGSENAVLFQTLFAGVVSGLPSLAIPIAVVAQYLLVDRTDVSTRRLVETGVVVAVTMLLVGVWGLGANTRGAVVYAGTVGLFVPLLFLPLALAERQRATVVLAGTIVASPLLIVVGTGPYRGYAEMLFPLVYVPWALVAGTAGGFAYAYGRSVRQTRKQRNTGS